MNETVFVDTGAWYAYINAADLDHIRVRRFLDSFDGRLVTSSYVFDETVTLTMARLGHRRALSVGRTLLDSTAVTLIHVSPADEKDAWALFEKRADKSYSFTDCTSFIVMRNENIDKAVTVDPHFSQEGFLVEPVD